MDVRLLTLESGEPRTISDSDRIESVDTVLAIQPDGSSHIDLEGKLRLIDSYQESSIVQISQAGFDDFEEGEIRLMDTGYGSGFIIIRSQNALYYCELF